MKSAVLAFFQKALQRILSLDSESKNRLAILQGRHIAVELKNLDVTLHCVFINDSVELKSDLLDTPDAFIKGTPLTLMRMALTTGDRKHFFVDDVEIVGNAEIAEQVINLFDQLEIDCEEYASHLIGDVSAHQVGRLLRDAQRFVRHTNKTLSRNINEYIHEEIPLFPSVEAIKDFFHDVDEIRMDVDRLAVKVEHIKKRQQERL